MSSFKLKILACITMLMDHIGKIFSPAIFPFIYIGRLAFPIFAFQASMGFEHTKNIKKYISRLFIFALISQIPFHLFVGAGKLNVIFTLLFGIIALYLYKKLTDKNLYALAFTIIAFIAFLAEFLKTDYGCYGVFIIFLFYILKNNKLLMTIGFFFLTTILYGQRFLIYGFQYVMILQYIFTLLGIIPILLYNGKQGKKIKYIIYIFYPLHLFILYLIETFFLA